MIAPNTHDSCSYPSAGSKSGWLLTHAQRQPTVPKIKADVFLAQRDLVLLDVGNDRA